MRIIHNPSKLGVPRARLYAANGSHVDGAVHAAVAGPGTVRGAKGGGAQPLGKAIKDVLDHLRQLGDAIEVPARTHALLQEVTQLCIPFIALQPAGPCSCPVDLARCSSRLHAASELHSCHSQHAAHAKACQQVLSCTVTLHVGNTPGARSCSETLRICVDGSKINTLDRPRASSYPGTVLPGTARRFW